MNHSGKKGRSIQVHYTTLKKVLDENDIEQCDFLKMDCDGAEHEIFENLDAETLRRIGTICMEHVILKANIGPVSTFQP